MQYINDDIGIPSNIQTKFLVSTCHMSPINIVVVVFQLPYITANKFGKNEYCCFFRLRIKRRRLILIDKAGVSLPRLMMAILHTCIQQIQINCFCTLIVIKGFRGGNFQVSGETRPISYVGNCHILPVYMTYIVLILIFNTCRRSQSCELCIRIVLSSYSLRVQYSRIQGYQNAGIPKTL